MRCCLHPEEVLPALWPQDTAVGVPLVPTHLSWPLSSTWGCEIKEHEHCGRV